MRYFIPASERQGSCYFEFQPGRWRGRCWLPGSILLADERWEALRLTELFGGTPAMVAHSFSLSLANLLGLVCDPVAGTVEMPCISASRPSPPGSGSASRRAAGTMQTGGPSSTRPRRGQRPALRGTASSAFWACEWGRGCEVHWRRAATRPSSSSTVRTTASSPAPWGGRTVPAAAPQIRPC